MSQDALEDISKIYALELATDNQNPTAGGASVVGDTVLDTLRRNEPVLEPEEKALEAEWARIKDNFQNAKAKEVWQKLVPLVLMWSDSIAAVTSALANCEVLKDGSTVFFEYNAGLDAAQAVKKHGYARLKGACVKEVLDACISIVMSHLKGSDSALFVAGRNKDASGYMKKQLNAYKPRPVLQHYQASPLYDDFSKLAKIGGGKKCRAATIDPADDWIQLWKSGDAVPPAAPWKYFSGNSALKRIDNVPLLQTSDMPKVAPCQHSPFHAGVGEGRRGTGLADSRGCPQACQLAQQARQNFTEIYLIS